MFELVIGRYDMGNKKSTFRLILTVSVLAICGVVAFVIVQSWMKGRISEPELFDLSAIQSNIHDNQRRALKPIATSHITTISLRCSINRSPIAIYQKSISVRIRH